MKLHGTALADTFIIRVYKDADLYIMRSFTYNGQFIQEMQVSDDPLPILLELIAEDKLC